MTYPQAVVDKIASWSQLERASVGLSVVTDGDWAHPGGRLLFLKIWGPDFELDALPNTLTLVDLRRVVDALDRCALWSPNAYETSCWLKSRWKWLPTFVHCNVVARAILQQPATMDPLADCKALTIGILDEKLGALVKLELDVVRAMAEATVGGYLLEDQVIYPRWRTIHPTGFARILAHDPPMNNWTKAQRTKLGAPAGFRWMQIRYPRLELRVLAADAGDEQAFELLSLSDDHLRRELRFESPEEMHKALTFVTKGWPGIETANALGLGPLVTHLQEVMKRTTPKSLLARPSVVPQEPDDERRYKLVATNYTSNGGATALKIALVKLWNAVQEQRQRMFLGFGQLFPHFDSIAYVLDERVPHDRHVESLQSMLQLQIATAGGVWTLAPEISVGPSLGELYPADDPTALTRTELARPGVVQIRCDVCGQVAATPAILQTHLAEDHADARP